MPAASSVSRPRKNARLVDGQGRVAIPPTIMKEIGLRKGDYIVFDRVGKGDYRLRVADLVVRAP